MRLLTTVFLMTTLFLAWPTPAATAQVGDWMTAASYYTHDPGTMKRVHQYAPDPKVIHTPDPSVSVYRHQRSNLRVDGSIDQYHKVYRTGGVVRPYGEWQRPFRPYSVPFSDWAYGSPYGHLANPPRTNPNLPPTLLLPGYGPGYPGPGYPGPGYPGPGYPGPGPGAPYPGGPFPGGPAPGAPFPGGSSGTTP